MKRLLACVLIGLLLLTGCTSTHSRDGLTLSLPKDFEDLSGAAYAQGLTLLYGNESMALLGIREEKAPLADRNLTLEDYALLVLELNGIDAPVEQADGYYCFTYQAQAEQVQCTYLSVVLEDSENFWTLQAYCPSADFAKNRDTMWQILTSATFE
jgi:hypothetical protein